MSKQTKPVFGVPPLEAINHMVGGTRTSWYHHDTFELLRGIYLHKVEGRPHGVLRLAGNASAIQSCCGAGQFTALKPSYYRLNGDRWYGESTAFGLINGQERSHSWVIANPNCLPSVNDYDQSGTDAASRWSEDAVLSWGGVVLANAVRWWMITRRRTTGQAIDRSDGVTRDTLRRLPHVHTLRKEGIIRRPLYFAHFAPTQAELLRVAEDAAAAYRTYVRVNTDRSGNPWSEYDPSDWDLMPYIGPSTKNINGGAILTSICIVPKYREGTAPKKLPSARLKFWPADLTDAQVTRHAAVSLTPEALLSVPQQSSYA